MQVSLAHLWVDFWVIFYILRFLVCQNTALFSTFLLQLLRPFVRPAEVWTFSSHHLDHLANFDLIWIDKAVVCIPIHVPLSQLTQLKAEGNIDIPQILIAANHRVNSFDGIKIKIFSWILSDPKQQPRTPHLMTMTNIIVIVTLMETIWTREPWLPSWLPRSLW